MRPKFLQFPSTGRQTSQIYANSTDDNCPIIALADRSIGVSICALSRSTVDRYSNAIHDRTTIDCRSSRDRVAVNCRSSERTTRHPSRVLIEWWSSELSVFCSMRGLELGRLPGEGVHGLASFEQESLTRKCTCAGFSQLKFSLGPWRMRYSAIVKTWQDILEKGSLKTIFNRQLSKYSICYAEFINKTISRINEMSPNMVTSNFIATTFHSPNKSPGKKNQISILSATIYSLPLYSP